MCEFLLDASWILTLGSFFDCMIHFKEKNFWFQLVAYSPWCYLQHRHVEHQCHVQHCVTQHGHSTCWQISFPRSKTWNEIFPNLNLRASFVCPWGVMVKHPLLLICLLSSHHVPLPIQLTKGVISPLFVWRCDQCLPLSARLSAPWPWDAVFGCLFCLLLHPHSLGQRASGLGEYCWVDKMKDSTFVSGQVFFLNATWKW